MSSFDGRSYFFLFGLPNGKRRLSFGRTEADALETLRIRLTHQEFSEIKQNDVMQCKQEEFRKYLDLLG